MEHALPQKGPEVTQIGPTDQLSWKQRDQERWLSRKLGLSKLHSRRSARECGYRFSRPEGGDDNNSTLSIKSESIIAIGTQVTVNAVSMISILSRALLRGSLFLVQRTG